MVPKKVDLEYLCKLTFEAFKFPTTFINKAGDILYEYKNFHFFNPLFEHNEMIVEDIHNYESMSSLPILKTTKYLENFLSFKINMNNDIEGTLLLGPVLFSGTSEDTINRMINDLTFTSNKANILNYYKNTTVFEKIDFLNKGRLVYFMIYNNEIDNIDIIQQSLTSTTASLEIDNARLNLSIRRQNKSFHHDRLYEEEIFQCIKEGRKEQLIEKLNTPPPQSEFGVLSKNSFIRDQKNIAITAITIATRKAMDAGLNPEFAYTLSDLYIQQVEEIEEARKVNDFMIEALAEFADQVRKSKQKKYSRSINNSISYVFKNLYEDLTLTDIAEAVDLSPSYLSTLFKKEVGMSLTTYIQQEKVEEAKKLLNLTNHSLLEICTLLHFTDQSYFVKVFKKITGLTPGQFSKQTQIDS